MKWRNGLKGRMIKTAGILFFLSLAPQLVEAAIPVTINHQGYLTYASGVPITGAIPMSFKIYNTPAAGVALWTETRTVTVTKGVYDVNLGELTPISLSFDGPYYLGVTVGADPEMTPRHSLTSVGYAYRARMAENGGGWIHVPGVISLGTGTDKVGIGTPTPAENLEIQSTSTAFVGIDRGTDQLGGISFKESGQTQWIFPFFRGWQYPDSNNLIVRDEKFRKDPMVFQAQTGHIGIGMTGGLLPGAKLDVNGDVRIRDAALRFTDSSSLPYPDNWIGMANNIDGATKWLHIGGITDGGVRRLALYADRSFFDGNVGIGRLPSQRMDVAGNIKMSGAGNGVIFPDGLKQTTSATDGKFGFPPPAYTSNWETLPPGGAIFYHGLGGDVNKYKVDLQFRWSNGQNINNSSLGGDRYWYYDWDTDTYRLFQYGYYFSNLTTSSIKIVRESDQYEDTQVRVRIWQSE